MIPPCPTTDNPPFVPGTYKVEHPPALHPVGRAGGICRLSQAAETAKACRGTRTPAPPVAPDTFNQL